METVRTVVRVPLCAFRFCTIPAAFVPIGMQVCAKISGSVSLFHRAF